MNFKQTAIIRCSLYQLKKEDELSIPHAHKLMRMYASEEREDPHDLPVSEDIGYQAVYVSLPTCNKY